jgi:hypothetical protein
MSEIMLDIIQAIGFFGLIILSGVAFWATVIAVISAVVDGETDVEYPEVAKGDYRVGPLRWLYLMGRAKGKRDLIRKERNRQTTATRAKARGDANGGWL